MCCVFIGEGVVLVTHVVRHSRRPQGAGSAVQYQVGTDRLQNTQRDVGNTQTPEKHTHTPCTHIITCSRWLTPPILAKWPSSDTLSGGIHPLHRPPSPQGRGPPRGRAPCYLSQGSGMRDYCFRGLPLSCTGLSCSGGTMGPSNRLGPCGRWRVYMVKWERRTCPAS